jgi:hypothetical protein
MPQQSLREACGVDVSLPWAVEEAARPYGAFEVKHNFGDGGSCWIKQKYNAEERDKITASG